MSGSRMFEMYRKENPDFVNQLGFTADEKYLHEYSEMFVYLMKLFEDDRAA
jgi:hypothetical protein